MDANWILILNNDTLVALDFFDQMKLIISQENLYSICPPVIFYNATPDRVWYMGDYFMRGMLLTHNPYRKKRLPFDFVSGCAMFVRREVFENVGLFDPEMIKYGEEVDFCWRARQAGFRADCAPRHKCGIRSRSVQNMSNRNLAIYGFANRFGFTAGMRAAYSAQISISRMLPACAGPVSLQHNC